MMISAEEVEQAVKDYNLYMECWYSYGEWHCRIRARSRVGVSFDTLAMMYLLDGTISGWDVQRSGGSLLEAQLNAANAYAKLAVHH